MENPAILEFRSKATDTALRWINVETCWHLDVWLYGDSYGLWYIKARTGNGLGKEIAVAWFALARDRFDLLCLVKTTKPISDIEEYNMASKAAVKAMPDLHKSYWRLFAPLISLWPRGEYKRRSVKMHFIKPLGVVDPCEGIINHYGATGRALRDGARTRKGK